MLNSVFGMEVNSWKIIIITASSNLCLTLTCLIYIIYLFRILSSLIIYWLRTWQLFYVLGFFLIPCLSVPQIIPCDTFVKWPTVDKWAPYSSTSQQFGHLINHFEYLIKYFYFKSSPICLFSLFRDKFPSLCYFTLCFLILSLLKLSKQLICRQTDLFKVLYSS